MYLKMVAKERKEVTTGMRYRYVELVVVSRLTAYVRQWMEAVGCTVIGNVLLDLRIVVITGGDVELKRFCEEDCQSAGCAAQFEDAAGRGEEKGRVAEQPVGEGESAGPEKVGVEGVEGELANLQLLSHARM